MCASGLLCSPRIVVSHPTIARSLPTSLDLTHQVGGAGAEVGRDVAQRRETCSALIASGSDVRAGKSVE